MINHFIGAIKEVVRNLIEGLDILTNSNTNINKILLLSNTNALVI
jgi:hypothetical protein